MQIEWCGVTRSPAHTLLARLKNQQYRCDPSLGTAQLDGIRGAELWGSWASTRGDPNELGGAHERRIENHLEGGLTGADGGEGDVESGYSIRIHGRHGVLVVQNQVESGRSHADVRPRDRREAHEYHAQRPPPGRKTVEHASLGYKRTATKAGAYYR